VIIPVPDAERVCPCGCQKTVISYESKQIIHYEPPVFEIIEQKREIMACPEGCDGAMVTAPAPLQVLPKSKASESLLAFLVVSKLEDRQPLYHLEKQLRARYDIDCSRQTMARWVIELVDPLRPFWNIMKDGAIDYDISSCDATTLQVLKEPGRKAETKSYVYCMMGGPPGQEVILYDYNDRLHKSFIHDWYRDYKGFLHCDGDNFFDLIGDSNEVQRVNCNAHARRKFEPISKATKGAGLAKEALRFYKALYKIEREAKEQGLNPEARMRLRQRESVPILETFKQWLDKHISLVLPQSPLGKAIQYCLNRWEGLTRYCEDGRLEIDNNHNEREIKPFVMARKNFLFSSSVDGAYALCVHLSLIRTAKRHGLDPYHYYVHLLKSVPHCQSVGDYEKLLPWNLQADDLKAP
jgi:transposase